MFGPRYGPLFGTLSVVYNVVSGWNIDLANVHYKTFFQIFPFHWVIYVMRYLLYGSLPVYRYLGSVIVLLYWLWALLLFVYLQLPVGWLYTGKLPQPVPVIRGSSPPLIIGSTLLK